MHVVTKTVTKVVKKPYTPHIRHKSRGGNTSGLPNKTQQTYGTALMKTLSQQI